MTQQKLHPHDEDLLEKLKKSFTHCRICGIRGPAICTLGDRCENKLKMEGKNY